MLRNIREWRAANGREERHECSPRVADEFLIGKEFVAARSREGLASTISFAEEGNDGWNRCSSSDERKG
jgi:hypothetical protein